MSQGRRYPARYMVRARELSKAGWSNARIARELGREFGQEPSRRIVGFWVNPRQYERYQRACRRRHRQRNPIPHQAVPKLQRMAELRAAGLSPSGVAIVMRLDFGISMSRDQVRSALEDGTLPRPLRALSSGRELMPA